MKTNSDLMSPVFTTNYHKTHQTGPAIDEGIASGQNVLGNVPGAVKVMCISMVNYWTVLPQVITTVYSSTVVRTSDKATTCEITTGTCLSFYSNIDDKIIFLTELMEDLKIQESKLDNI